MARQNAGSTTQAERVILTATVMIILGGLLALPSRDGPYHPNETAAERRLDTHADG